jgi:hypothetical protein
LIIISCKKSSEYFVSSEQTNRAKTVDPLFAIRKKLGKNLEYIFIFRNQILRPLMKIKFQKINVKKRFLEMQEAFLMSLY